MSELHKSGQSYMINLVVDDLDAALDNVKEGGAVVLEERCSIQLKKLVLPIWVRARHRPVPVETWVILNY